MEQKRLVKRAQRQFITNIESFAKRSKFVTIRYTRTFWGRVCMQIDVSKYNKVVNEMIEYIKTFCNYVEKENNGSMWLRNYNDLAESEEDCNEWALEYDICVHCINK